MNQPFSTNVNSGADQAAERTPAAMNWLYRPWTADEIDQAVLEADTAWRQTGKITRYSQHLVKALVARLPSAVHTQPIGHSDWRAATEADRTKPMLAVRWKVEDGPWIYPTSIQAESLLANDIERCQVKPIGTRDPAQALRDNTMRVERIVMLDAMLGDQLYPAQALEHLMQEETDTLLSLFTGMPDWLRKALIDNVDFEDAFIEWVNQDAISGLAVQFATPVMKWDASGESSTYSWGNYTTRWFYADSMDGAIAMALGWVEAIRQAEKSKKGRA